MCVAEQPRTALETLFLDFPRRDYPLANIRTALCWFVGGQLLVADRYHLYVEVDAVHQRTGNLAQVVLYLVRFTGAGDGRVVVVAARTRIHGGDEHERGRKFYRIFGS